MLKLLITDFKILFRIPLVVLFNNIFPIFMAIIFISSFDNMEIIPNYNFSDKYFLISLGIAIAPLSLISLPLSISELCNSGQLTRLNLHGINKYKVLISKVCVHFFISIIQLIVLYVVIDLIYGLNTPELNYLISFIALYLTTVIAMLSVGSVVGLLFKNTEITQVFGTAIMFSTLLLIGAFGDYTGLPDILKTISEYVPLKYLVQNGFDVWSEQEIIIPMFYKLSTITIILSSCLVTLLFKYRKI